MAKKVEQVYHPYIEVEGVSTRLLDFLLISYTDIEALRLNATVDNKYLRKFKKVMLEEDLSGVHKKWTLSEELVQYYNVYNELVKDFWKDKPDEIEILWTMLEQNESEDAIKNEIAPPELSDNKYVYFSAVMQLFRLYKKGRSASVYVPCVIEAMRQQLPGFVELFEQELPEEEMVTQLEQYMAKYAGAEVKGNADKLTYAQFKEQMQQLMQQMPEEASNKEELELLQGVVNEKDQELKNVQKQLKKRDDQIAKLQKAAALQSREQDALEKNIDELKRANGVRAEELSKLRKSAQEAENQAALAVKQYNALKESQQRDLERARQQEAAAYEQKLRASEAQSSDKLTKLEAAYEQLQKRVSAEREEWAQQEIELERLRQFQSIYVQLSAENERLVTENKELVAQLQQTQQKQTVMVQQSLPLDEEVPEEIVAIDQDIFKMIANEPESDEQQDVCNGEIYVIEDQQDEDDDLINFAELLTNRPV
ncbi:MAG: hypothetical protein ABS951_00700 [Solibacillus sp.]